MYPEKLRSGDHVRVIAPTKSLSIIGAETRRIAGARLSEMGLSFSFGDHAEETDDFASSSIQSRIADLHAAFKDKRVKAILTAIGGFNSNQLLRYIDWDLVQANPKIFCGFSDITALNNAIFAKTGLVTYSGPHYSSFGQEMHFDYTLDHFRRCVFSDAPYTIQPSSSWSDDAWFTHQRDRKLIPNPGWLVINPGQAEGTLLGANLCTFNLLQGTEYFPDLTGSVLLLEDDSESAPHHFDRNLQSLIHQPGFSGVRCMVIGRFQNDSHITPDIVTQIVKSKQELARMPIIANVDFGHTDPKITFPIGGKVSVSASDHSKITIIKH